VKPVGEPDAGDRHVRFDERGWETGRCRMAQVTAPILDSTTASDIAPQANVSFWENCGSGCRARKTSKMTLLDRLLRVVSAMQHGHVQLSRLSSCDGGRSIHRTRNRHAPSGIGLAFAHGHDPLLGKVSLHLRQRLRLK
jgi:hypothetical protein